MAYSNGQDAREGEADWMESGEIRGKSSRTWPTRSGFGNGAPR
jgi:hypothetical protein